MQKLTFINLRGEAVEFGGGPPYVLEKVRGLGKPGYKLSAARGVYQHGETPYGFQLDSRYVELSFHIQGRSRVDLYQKRQELLAALAMPVAFDGTRLARLIYQNDYGSWWIHAIPEGPDPDIRLQNWLLSAKLCFRCPNPYWKANVSDALTLAMNEATFKLPFGFPVRLGNRGFYGTAFNGGQVVAPPLIEIAGSGETPTLINHTTGASITVARAVATGDLLVIDTDPEALSVVIRTAQGEAIPAHGYLGLDSSLAGFTLRPGMNELEYKPSAPSIDSLVRIRWTPRMEGV
ncbi:MAG: phage tail family protein [Clostridia bacterium]|nr:phage tail family protein [Clostridia bacterium]